MSKPNDNPADPFKKALAEATKVMADDPELAVSYSVDPAGQTIGARHMPGTAGNIDVKIEHEALRFGL